MQRFYRVLSLPAQRIVDTDDRRQFPVDAEIQVGIRGGQRVIFLLLSLRDTAALVLKDKVGTSDDDLFVLYHNDLLYQCRPLLRVTCQQFFMPQILFMDDRMVKMPQVAEAILFAHFQGVKNMNFRTGHIDLIRQRCNEIGVKLVFAAFHGHIRPPAAQHVHKRLHIGFRLPHAFLKLFLQDTAFQLSIPDEGIEQGQEQRRL